MDVREVRRLRLIELIDQYGKVKDLADMIGTNPNTLTRIKNRTVDTTSSKPRMMGSKTARDIEKALNLPEYWMDRMGFEDSQGLPLSTNEDLLELAVGAVIRQLLASEIYVEKKKMPVKAVSSLIVGEFKRLSTKTKADVVDINDRKD